MRPGRRQLAATAVVALVVALSVAGCADPGPARPLRPLTDPATLAPATDPGTATPTIEPAPWPAERWWDAFGDAALSALVDRALSAQPSLQVAQARVQLAAAQLDAARAGSQPQATLTAEATDQRFTAKGLVPPALGGATRWNNSLQLGGRWELDLFGRQRAVLDAAIGQQRAATADAQAARVLLAAELATQWFALARQLEQQRLATRALDQRLQLQALVRQRVGAGLDSEVDAAQVDALVAQSQLDLQALADGTARARHALAELSGQGPQALAAADPVLAPLRVQPLPAVLGADLLGRRADLVAQRWRVEAALRDIDLARTRFYPDIDLVAFAGLSSLGLDNLLNAGARTWGVGPALRLPVFDGGRLRAQLAARQADADAAIEAWNTTLLRALREAADAVATMQALQGQQAAQALADAAADRAHALALQRYQAGLGTSLHVLVADTAALAQRRAAADLKARRLAADVALSRALGGGYRSPDPLPAPAPALALNPSRP